MRISDFLNASNRSFTLIELLVVIIIIALLYMLVWPTHPRATQAFKIEKLYNILYPEGTCIIYADHTAVIEMNNSKKAKYSFGDITIWVPKGEDLQEYTFDRPFVYMVKRGVGSSFILETKNAFYVFKPFSITKTTSFEKAQKLFFHTPYQILTNGIL